MPQVSPNLQRPDVEIADFSVAGWSARAPCASFIVEAASVGGLSSFVQDDLEFVQVDSEAELPALLRVSYRRDTTPLR